jgi:hypothetical protein
MYGKPTRQVREGFVDTAAFSAGFATVGRARFVALKGPQEFFHDRRARGVIGRACTRMAGIEVRADLQVCGFREFLR